MVLGPHLSPYNLFFSFSRTINWVKLKYFLLGNSGRIKGWYECLKICRDLRQPCLLISHLIHRNLYHTITPSPNCTNFSLSFFSCYDFEDSFHSFKIWVGLIGIRYSVQVSVNPMGQKLASFWFKASHLQRKLRAAIFD